MPGQKICRALRCSLGPIGLGCSQILRTRRRRSPVRRGGSRCSRAGERLEPQEGRRLDAPRPSCCPHVRPIIPFRHPSAEGRPLCIGMLRRHCGAWCRRGHLPVHSFRSLLADLATVPAMSWPWTAPRRRASSSFRNSPTRLRLPIARPRRQSVASPGSRFDGGQLG